MWLFKYKVILIKIQWSLKFNSSVPCEPHFKGWGAARGQWLRYWAARIHDILSLWEARAHSAGRNHDLFSASVCTASLTVLTAIRGTVAAGTSCAVHCFVVLTELVVDRLPELVLMADALGLVTLPENG